jgi:hypothetical protein
MALAVITEKGRISFDVLSESGRERIDILLEIGERIVATTSMMNLYCFEIVMVDENLNLTLSDLGIVVFDSITIVDVFPWLGINVNDTISLIELRFLDFSYLVFVEDTITPFEFFDIALTNFQFLVADDITISEFAGGQEDPSGIASIDNIGITEDIQTFLDALFASAQEDIAATDSAETSFDVLVPSVDESISIIESAALFDLMDLFAEDDALIEESFEYIFAWLITPVDEIFIDESVSFYKYGVPQRLRCVPAHKVAPTVYTREGVCV